MHSLLFSLRTRVLLPVGLGFGVFLLALTYHAIDERRMRLEFVKDQLSSTAKLVAAEQHIAIQSTRDLLASLIPSLELRRFAGGEDCQDALTRTVKHLPRLANVLLALPDGKVVCSAVRQSGPLNVADRPYFRTALASSDTVIGAPFKGRLAGKWVLPIYRAMRDEADHVQGVIGIGLELDWINRELANVNSPEGARLGLIDAQGRVLARYPDPEGWVGRNASETSFFRAVKAHGGEGVAEEVGFDGVRRIYGLARFASTEAGPITLWIGFAADGITAEAERDFLRAVSGALALLLLTFSVVLV